MTDAVEPLFAHDEPGGLFSISQASARIAEAQEAKGQIENQLRDMAQKGLIFARAKKGSGRTAHNLYKPADLATAAALRAIRLTGVSDMEIQREISRACYALDGDDPADAARDLDGFAHPITAALSAFIRQNEGWNVRVDVLVSATTGERHVVARCYDSANHHFPAPKAGWFPVSTTLIPVWRYFPAILRSEEGAN